MERKTFTANVKLDEKGALRVVFATMGVIDKQGDVTLPGAFGEQDVRLSAYNHSSWGGALPVGKGAIKEVNNEAVFEGAFFLQTSIGKEHYETIKALGDLTEYSYGFDVLESGEGEQEGRKVRFLKKLRVFEVSPVLLGAGVGTRTLDIKSDDGAPEGSGASLVDRAERVLVAARELTESAKSIAAAAVDGGLSARKKERLKAVAAELQELAGGLLSLDTTAEVEALLLDYQRTLAEATSGGQLS